MKTLDVDDLYGKALSAVQKNWNQKYVMSKEEERAFVVQIKQIKHKDSNPMLETPYLQHKLGLIDFLPTKQEYEFVKEDWADEMSLRFFSGKTISEDHEIFKDKSLKSYS